MIMILESGQQKRVEATVFDCEDALGFDEGRVQDLNHKTQAALRPPGKGFLRQRLYRKT